MLGAVDGDVIAVPDLCRMAAKNSKRLRDLAAAPELVVIACYPRAVKWLFAYAGVSLETKNVTFCNMRTQSAPEIARHLGLQEAAEGDLVPLQEHEDTTDSWVPWYPVIDRERCSGCRQCVNFCLFGVYELDEAGNVTVVNPEQCKNNCPACARMCPEVAIMFPKIDEISPIAGDPVDPEKAPHGKVRVNVRELFNGNIHEKLQKRRQSRLTRTRPSKKDEHDTGVDKTHDSGDGSASAD